MSQLHFPRIHFRGRFSVNPGTANNDDYAQQPSVLLPKSYGPYAGQALGLIESKTVQARTFGMADADFIAWAQQAQTFDLSDGSGKTVQLIPAEWNYYGDMSARSLAIVRKRMELGDVNYLALLNAQQTYQQAVLSLAQAKAARYADTVALFQALGGGWWNRSDVDPERPLSITDVFQ